VGIYSTANKIKSYQSIFLIKKHSPLSILFVLTHYGGMGIIMNNSIVFKRKKATVEFSKLVSFGESNNLFLDKFCAFFLALSPILQHYKGPFVNAGFSILIFFFPFVLLRLLNRMRGFKIASPSVVAVLIMFSLYKVVDHGPDFYKFAHGMVIIIYYLAAALGCINVKHLIKSAYYVAMAASVCIIVQYICFYALGFHLQLVPTSLLLPECDQWILGAETGLVGITGRYYDFYRPAAFFLEPSHMFLYIFPYLFIMLLSKNTNRWRIRKALLFTLGLLLSTSGMGISVAACAWALYFGLRSGKKNIFRLRNIFKLRNTLILTIFLVLLVGLYFTVPTLTQSVDRIIGSNIGGNNAISGRITLSISLIKSLTGFALLYGAADSTSGIEFNMPGFMATMYKYGLIGIVLSYAFYVRGLFKLKAQYFWISLVIIIVSFFSAHTHGTFYMLFYVFILLEGNNTAQYERASLLKAQCMSSNKAAHKQLVAQ
jgi:hypothetical protein